MGSASVLAALAERIISSRLLVLQSKRIQLDVAQARRRRGGSEMGAYVGRLERDVSVATERYKSAVINWGDGGTPQFLIVAYGSLIQKAERLRTALENGSPSLSATDRLEVEAEVRALEGIINGWRSVTRQSMLEVA
jgi:hypothetical protein